MKKLVIIFVVSASTNMIVIILQRRDELMNRIYIIGSISQSTEICKLARKLKKKNNEVRYVKLSALSFKQTVKECFKNILWCNELIVIPKLDETIGKGVTYEICFAEYLNKQITFYKE